MQPNRRHLMQVFALGLASGMTTRLWANELTGYNVAAATEFLSTIPRKTGDPVVFTYALDKSPIKATTGGWARDVTVRNCRLPPASPVRICTSILVARVRCTGTIRWNGVTSRAVIVR